VSGARTEQPTPRRLREARRRGELPQGRELTAAAALLAGLAALAATGPSSAGALADLVRHALSGREVAPADALAEAGRCVLRAVLAPALASTAAAVLGGMIQTGFAFAPGGAAPRLERLDPARGLRRLFSPQAILRVALALAKAIALLAVAAGWISGQAAALAELPRAGSAALWRIVPAIASLAFRLGATFAVAGALDALLSLALHRRSLRMTRDEVRRDAREDDGDPQHRAERRRLHRALLEAGPVARATVVVVNPTHVAIALRHERGADEAPRVLAKGTGPEAARIRSAARRAGVPIVRDVPLARALLRLAEVGEEIPEALFEAAAAVLAHLYAREDSR